MPPFNGSGTYTRPAGQPVVSGTAISETVFNTLTSDLATALSLCVTRDGQSPATGNLPMGTYKLTGLGSGTAKTDSANYGQVQSSAAKVITVGGTADVITGSLSPTLTAYVTGDMFSFVVGSTNTTNVTINLDGLGAKAVTNGTTALVAGELTANRVAIVQYDGTRFQLLNTALVLTNANLTGHVTSVGNAAVLGSFTIAQLNTAVSDANVASAGANSDITSLTGLTTPLTIAQGGIGAASLASASIVTYTGSETLTNKTLTSPVINSATVATVSGTAPLYMCRAWINFNGTGTVAINASGNVSSLTDNGNGDYTVNFTTALSDVNYSVGMSTTGHTTTTDQTRMMTIYGTSSGGASAKTVSSIRVLRGQTGGVGVLDDGAEINVAIFR